MARPARPLTALVLGVAVSGCALGVQTSVGLTLDTRGELGAQVRVGMHGGTRTEVVHGAGDPILSPTLMGAQLGVGYLFARRVVAFDVAPISLGVLVAPSGPDGLVHWAVAQPRLTVTTDGDFTGGGGVSYSLLAVGDYVEEVAPDGGRYAPTRRYHAFGATVDAILGWTKNDDEPPEVDPRFGASFFVGASWMRLWVDPGYCGSIFEGSECGGPASP